MPDKFETRPDDKPFEMPPEPPKAPPPPPQPVQPIKPSPFPLRGIMKILMVVFGVGVACELLMALTGGKQYTFGYTNAVIFLIIALALYFGSKSVKH